MKRIVAVCIIFVIILVFAGVHIYKIFSLSNEILRRAEIVNEAFEKDDWDEIESQMKHISNEWEDHRVWASLTLSTKQVDEIEISMKQSCEYSKLKSKEDFIGEFKMFCMLVEHLPKQECVSIEELL